MLSTQTAFMCKYCQVKTLDPGSPCTHDRMCPIISSVNHQNPLSYPSTIGQFSGMHNAASLLRHPLDTNSVQVTIPSSHSYSSSLDTINFQSAQPRYGTVTWPTSLHVQSIPSMSYNQTLMINPVIHTNRLLPEAGNIPHTNFQPCTILSPAEASWQRSIYDDQQQQTYSGPTPPTVWNSLPITSMHHSMSNFHDRLPLHSEYIQNTNRVSNAHSYHRNLVNSYPDTLPAFDRPTVFRSILDLVPHNHDNKNCNESPNLKHTRKRSKETNETVPCKFARSANQHGTIRNDTARFAKNGYPQVQDHDEGFSMLKEPIKLYHAVEDERNLTPLQCFLRKYCIEVYTATQVDTTRPCKGKGKVMVVGQVGLRCSFCHVASSSSSSSNEDRGSVYFPQTVDHIYNGCMNLIQRHFIQCSCIPSPVRTRYLELKQTGGRCGSSREYWTQSAMNLGLVDTPDGIRYCTSLATPPQSSISSTASRSDGDNSLGKHVHIVAHPSLQSTNDNNHSIDRYISSSHSPADKKRAYENACEKTVSIVSSLTARPARDIPYLCFPEDEDCTTRFTYLLMRQMTLCNFTECDRLGKRKDLPLGFGGIECRHCISDFGTGRFFPSTMKTVSDTTKTLSSLHMHILKCDKCPSSVKDQLNDLRNSHDRERAELRFGSQSAFFWKIWSRLHNLSSNNE